MHLFSNKVFYSFTSPWNNNKNVYRQLEDFAKSLGWFPSDIIEERKKDSLTTGHLFVEHGLDNSAVISFLNNRFSYEQLSTVQQKNILKISYNNLVDLHISVDTTNVFGIHNRIENAIPIYNGPITDSFENLRSDFYSTLLDEKKYKANINALDDALIDTISYWKRLISSELNDNNINEELSTLFNAVIFCRAVEDNYHSKLNEASSSSNKALIGALLNKKGNETVVSLIQSTLKRFNLTKWPRHLINKEKLFVFDKIDNNTLFNFFSDFYSIKHTPYEYDFSIISKHALSRIYERYVSILKIEDSPQLSFFAPIPAEHKNKLSGSYYTPQFIARFFSRYVEQHVPDFKFQTLKIVEPAVGSGIFLRTLLERKSDALENYGSELLSKSFESVLGIDINPTACHAAKLSLSLLHLVSTGSLPDKDLKIFTTDSLDYFKSNKHLNTADICISNPPFVSYNALSDDIREKIKTFLGEVAFGKSDLYLPFIKIAIDILKPGGLGLFVLPNTFLISESAKNLRKYLSQNTFIKCVVDLSDIQVFENTGIYPILLIFEKTNSEIIQRKQIYSSKPLAIIAKVQDNVGKALYDVLRQSKVETTSYSIYDVSQDFFDSNNWFLLPPSEYSLKNKLDSLTKLNEFAEVRTGFASGNDEAFLLSKKEIPKGEENIYIPYLSDREMNIYITPRQTEKYLFYPFENNKIITENVLKHKFFNSFKRLQKYKDKLNDRTEVKQNKLKWWQPNRPRTPDFMLVKKIITPYLVLTPKFGLDIKGIYAVSRGPFIVAKEEYQTDDFLYYLLAVLNSSVCFWYLLTQAPKYQHGYAVLEKAQHLNNLPIPSFANNKNQIHQIVKLVQERLVSSNEKAIFIENKIDALITYLYGLTNDELKFLNLPF